MDNLKVRVNNKAESKEVQELFFELGGAWGGVKKIQGWDDIRQLYLQNGHITYSDDIDYFNNDPLEEITITKLRDLVVLRRNDKNDATHSVDGESGLAVMLNGVWYGYNFNEKKWELWVDDDEYQLKDLKPIEKLMKEYLRKNQDGVYVLELSCEQEAQEPHANNWIEVPEGADVAAKSELNNGVVFYKDNGLFQFNEKWIQCGIEDSDGTTHNSLENFLAFGFGNKIVWQRSETESNDKDLPKIKIPVNGKLDDAIKLAKSLGYWNCQFNKIPSNAFWLLCNEGGTVDYSTDESILNEHELSDVDNSKSTETENTGAAQSKRKHSHYFKDVSQIDVIDVYDVLKLFEVTDPCLQHIVKKALCAGKRGHKDMQEDLQNIVDTAIRAVELNK